VYNLTRNPIRTLAYDTAERVVDLTRGVNLHELRIRLTGTVTVATGAADGTLIEDGVARLLERVRLIHDGFAYVDVSGRDLYHLRRRMHARVRAATELAIPGVQAATPFALDLTVPLSPAYLANPYDVFLSAMPTSTEFALYIQFATGKTTAGSGAGSAALVTGGDRTVTLPTFSCDISELCSISNKAPMYLPVVTGTYSDQFAAADTELAYQLRQSRRILGQLVQAQHGANAVIQADAINRITLQSDNTYRYNRVGFEHFKAEEVERFPAVPATGDTGTLYLNFADNGKLGTVLDPRAMGQNARYLFDVDAPTSAPGRLRIVNYELGVKPGVTAQ
jgi:hypothetical protein